MFLAKLKLMVGVVMVVTALGASGLVYRAAGQPASPAEKPSDGKPKSELERLRHENELLKLNLEVVLEKVRAQEAELRALKAQPARILRFETRRVENAQPLRWEVKEGQPMRVEVKPNLKPNVELIIQNPRNKEELQRAIDEMEKALKGLREQLKNEAVPKKGKAKEELQRDQSQLEQAEKQLKDLTEKLEKLQSDSFLWQERATWSERMSRPGRQYVTIFHAEADQARLRAALFDEAETALKILREARDAETQRKAADALDKALKKLSGQMKKTGQR